jgi:hypothetical protein
MIDEHYSFSSREDKSLYYFQSVGAQGEILKVVTFYLTKSGKWNLGFGDWNSGKVDDRVVSNNSDMFKVMKTVISCAYDFSESYPDRVIQVVPVDEKRKLLYHGILKRHQDIIEKTFWIEGLQNNLTFPFNKEDCYEQFYFYRK